MELPDADRFIKISQPPERHEEGNVYVHSVKKENIAGKIYLVISGSLPESCSSLKSVFYAIEEKFLLLDMRSWRPPDLMCLQVLVDFEYLIEIEPPQQIDTLKNWEAKHGSGTFE